ncbi:FAD-dependent monooxygenase [Arthrobacter sp. GMC3]|uniref:FAD-dependent monooxygenase n=1 Tax=Arthrobacter sp. GMC3 TaxID=2058894 RepID=UPI002157536A|nr:FAD-dependent monooxygenase [Arthrobacter sp. GMC3]
MNAALCPSTPQVKPPHEETTTTIVIGSGFSGLAVAAELNRQGIDAIVVDSFRPLGPSSPAPTTGGVSLDALSERTDILRLLEHYARRHHLDIRPATSPLQLTRQSTDAHTEHQWTVHTATGTLTAHSVVFTRGALNQLRRVLHSVGVNTSHELTAAMHSLGLYLVGVGDLVVPTTHEILHQAKRAGASISARRAARSGAAVLIPA